MSRRIAVYYPYKSSLPSYFLSAVQDLANERGYAVELIAFHSYKSLWGEAVSKLVILLQVGVFRYIYERFFLFRMLKKKNFDTIVLPFSRTVRRNNMSSCIFYYDVPNALYQRRLAAYVSKFKPYGARWVSNRGIARKEGKKIAPTFFTPLYNPSVYFQNLPSLAVKQELEDVSMPFFLCYCPEGCYTDDVVYLLKAFSWFKKRHQSGIQLVLCVHKSFPVEVIRLSTYKYEQDIKVNEVSGVEECERFYRLAYAAIYPFDVHTNFDIPAIRFGLSLDSPLIVARDVYTQELVQNAALTFEREKISSLASSMNKLFIDEQLREEMIAASKALRRKRLQHVQQLQVLFGDNPVNDI